jgi:hypothetical protein
VSFHELTAAHSARSRRDERNVAAAVRRQRRGAVRADDAEILQPVVVGDPVHVVENQRHSPAAPVLALAAELARSLLETRCVEPVLQVATRVRRALDQDFPERYGLAAAKRVQGGPARIEVDTGIRHTSSTYRLIVRWLPPAGRIPSLRRTSL